MPITLTVTGWVRNLPDGRVQLLVEEPAAAGAAFLQAVRDRWAGDFDEERDEDQEPTRAHTRFGIVP